MASKINKLKKIYVVNETGDGSKEFVEIYDSSEQIQSAVEAAKEAVKQSVTPAPKTVVVPSFITTTELPTTINVDNIDADKSDKVFTNGNFSIKTYLSGGSNITIVMSADIDYTEGTKRLQLKNPLDPIATIDASKLIGKTIEFLTPLISSNVGIIFGLFIEYLGRDQINLYMNNQYGNCLTFRDYSSFIMRLDDAVTEDDKAVMLKGIQVMQGLFSMKELEHI